MENVSCDWNTTLSPIKLTPCSLVKKKNQNKKKTNIQINQHQAIYQTFCQNQ